MNSATAVATLSGRSGTLTRKRSLVQIQYGPPGISCSWPYQVALCGPTTALRRALLGPSSAQVPAQELARGPRRANGLERLTAVT